jgi:hypothetical protein
MTTDFFTSPTLPLGVGPDIDAACNLDLACDARNAGAGSLSPVAGSDVVPCGGVVFACAVLSIKRFFGFLRPPIAPGW